MRRRLAAVIALAVAAATVALAVAQAVSEFPRGLVALACVVVAGAASWYGELGVDSDDLVGASTRSSTAVSGP